MVDYLLYIVPTYIIGYLLVIILCKNCTLFDYINGKTTRAVTSVFIIIGAFILVTILLDRFNLSENTSKYF